MRRHQKSTIKEVAERAGVSVASVSYFASGREGKCSVETAKRIREAIEFLRYTPNSLSRSLRTRSTKTIGIAIGKPTTSTDPRYSFIDRLWAGIDGASDDADYLQLYYPNSVRFGASLDPFLDGRIDGLLINTGMNDYRPREIAAAGMPVVVVGRALEIPEGCGSVDADERDTVDLGLTHLWELGHRRIAHVAGPCMDLPGTSVFSGAGMSAAIIRRAAFGEWLTVRGVFDPALVGAAPTWARAQSAETVREMVEGWLRLDKPPTAIFCANDAFALVAMETVHEHGLNVPRDISIVGVDNQIEGMFSQPALTTIAVPAEEIGAQSVRLLFKLIGGATIDECRLVLPVQEFITRGTTATVKGTR